MDLRAQLSSLFPMTTDEISRRLANAKMKYNYERLEQPIKNAVKTYQVIVAKQQQAYAALPGIKTRFFWPLPCAIKSGAISDMTFRIDGSSSLATNVDSNMQCLDGSLLIRYIVPFEFHTLFFNEIKIPGDAAVEVDGKKMSYADLTLSPQTLFHQLNIVALNITITSRSYVGTIVSNGEYVSIKFAHKVGACLMNFLKCLLRGHSFQMI